MPLGADDHQSTDFYDARPKLNVGAASCHVGRNRDRAWLSGARHDLGFLHVELCVQHVVRNFLPFQHSAEQLGGFHTHCTDQHRLTPRVSVFDFLDYGVVFFPARFVDAIVVIRPPHRPVRRNHVHIEFVNVVKLCRFRLGRAGHARKLLIKSEIILDRDRRQCLGLTINLDAFLRFNCLMQPVAPPSARHFAASEFVHNHDLVIFDDVLDIFLEEAVGAK